MLRKHESFAENEFYHLYNRGVEKREIFLDKKDYDRFIKLLYLTNGTKHIGMRNIFRQGQSLTEIMLIDKGDELVSIGAYVLMPNHFHILITPKIKDGVSLFMKKLSTAYSMYFNKKYNRTGALFQGAFKSEHVSNDTYLRYLYSYIHMNPVKLIEGESNWKENGVNDIAKVKNFLNNFEFSSYQDYLGQNRPQAKILNKESFPNYFTDAESSLKEIHDWLTMSSQKTDQENTV